MNLKLKTWKGKILLVPFPAAELLATAIGGEHCKDWP